VVATESHIDELQEQLAQQVTKTLTADERLSGLLTASTVDSNALQAFVDLKQLFLKGLDELIHQRTELKRQLDAAGDYLRAVEADRERLNAELVQAQKQGDADALT